jgi:hypothetical protein
VLETRRAIRAMGAFFATKLAETFGIFGRLSDSTNHGGDQLSLFREVSGLKAVQDFSSFFVTLRVADEEIWFRLIRQLLTKHMAKVLLAALRTSAARDNNHVCIVRQRRPTEQAPVLCPQIACALSVHMQCAGYAQHASRERRCRPKC